MVVEEKIGAMLRAASVLSYSYTDRERSIMRTFMMMDRAPLFHRLLFGLGLLLFATVLTLIIGITRWNMTPASHPVEPSFLAMNNAAMAKMMAGMKIEPSKNVDRDFVSLMVPHHQGAIDMAEAELIYGHNEPLRGLAQDIISTQQQEIVAMQLEELR
jgi:Domain of unknown function (DUF305)